MCRIIRKFEDGTHGIIRHCQPDPECADRCFALFYFYAFNNIVHHALAFSLASVLAALPYPTSAPLAHSSQRTIYLHGGKKGTSDNRLYDSSEATTI